MEEKKKIKLIIPEGMYWPEGVPVPEIDAEEVTIRKMIIDEDGKPVEKTETVLLPKLPNKRGHTEET